VFLICEEIGARSVIMQSKGKAVPVLTLIKHPTMKAYWGSGVTAPPFL